MDLNTIERDDIGPAADSAPAPAGTAKKVFVKTYGCQMNVYDSQRMTDALAADGYVATDAIDEADLVLLNTCHIREKAAEKVYSELGRIRDMKAERAAAGRELLIGVAGCVAQAEGDEIIRRAPAVDLVIGPQTYHRLPDVLARVRGGEKIVETEYAVEDKFEHLPQPKRAEVIKRGVTAFLTVQEGCDKFCTFCVVPYTRGSEVSRPVAQIVAEAEKLAEAGVREVTLLGQNVNAWHGEGADGSEWGLGRLLFRLAEIPGLARLRYTTSHPRDMDDELISGASRPAGADALSASAGAVGLRPHPQGDEPQAHRKRLSGADRAHPRCAHRHRAVRRLHRRLPGRDGGGFRGDDGTRAPGQLCLGLFVQIFAASRHAGRRDDRSGAGSGQGRTPAAPAGPAPEAAAGLRHEPGRQDHRRADREARPQAGQMVGRSPWLQPVIVDEKAGEIGDIIQVRITRTGYNSLFAELA